MVNKKKVFCIGAGVLIMGSLSWAASTTPQPRNGAYGAGNGAAGFSTAASSSPFPAGAISLVPPPAEMPDAGRMKMVTSARPMAPEAPFAAAAAPKTKKVAPVSRPAKPASRVRAASSMAPAKKSDKLFSYVRMLNFSPHPQEEEFLKDKPLVLKDHKYWLKVSYKESWDVIGDEAGNLRKLAFGISLMEGDKVVRQLQIPSAKLNAKKMKRGQILGIAEVAPYKFNISVDTFTVVKGSLSELTFKFDLIG